MKKTKQPGAKANAQPPHPRPPLARPPAPAPPHPAGARRASLASPAPTELETLNYAQTMVVPLRADHLERHRIVAYDKNSKSAWAFDLLRTQVLKAMEENGWRTLAITSPTPEAGKTVVAINLAMSIAHHTTKTALLVDFDLRRPKVAAYLGLAPEKWLNQVLAGECDLQEALINPGLPRLVVLPTQRPVSRLVISMTSTAPVFLRQGRAATCRRRGTVPNSLRIRSVSSSLSVRGPFSMRKPRSATRNRLPSH